MFNACLLNATPNANAKPHTKFMAYPPELLRHQIVAVSACVGLANVGVVAIIHGFRTDADYSTAFIGLGIAFLLVGMPGAYLTTAWYRGAARLVSAGKRISATATLVSERGFESTMLYAEIALPNQTTRIAVLIPPWEYTSSLGLTLPAGVFVEPRSALVKAISTERGMLWCIPHNIVLKQRDAA